MWQVLSEWYRKYLSDPQAVVLAFLLIGGFTIVITMGDMLMPALAALVIAYLLEGIVKFLEKHGAKRMRAVLPRHNWLCGRFPSIFPMSVNSRCASLHRLSKRSWPIMDRRF